jgi:hypothetical protein
MARGVDNRGPRKAVKGSAPGYEKGTTPDRFVKPKPNGRLLEVSSEGLQSANQRRRRLPRQSLSIKNPPVKSARALPMEPGSISGIAVGVAKANVGQAAITRVKPQTLMAHPVAAAMLINRKAESFQK